jgi:hypothetical protein
VVWLAGIIISKIKYFSFAKFMGVYTLLTTFIYIIFDLVYRLLAKDSFFYGASTWGSWILYSILTLILVPIVSFGVAYILAFLVNLVLKWIKGLELETL